MSPHICGVPVRRRRAKGDLMRLLLRPFDILRWRVRISVFVVHLMHHAAALQADRARHAC